MDVLSVMPSARAGKKFPLVKFENSLELITSKTLFDCNYSIYKWQEIVWIANIIDRNYL